MKAAVALALSLSLLGCFPNNARHRTIAKYVEGASLAGGIVISAVSQTGADCDRMEMAGVDTNCRTTAKWLSTAGVTLILGGLLGFVATIATAEDDSANEIKRIEVSKKPTPEEQKQLTLPPGVQPQPATPAAPATPATPTTPTDGTAPTTDETATGTDAQPQPSGSASTTPSAPQR